MATEFGMWDYMRFFVADYLQDVHTIKPGVVIAVNGNTIDCSILTKTRFNSDTEEEQPDVFGVPFLVISGNRGNAKITMPIQPGDNVLILFSDRNVGELLDSDGQQPVTSYSSLTHNYDPILALPCFFTSPNEIENDTENVVIANGSTTVVIAPDGNVTITAPTVAIEGNATISGDLAVEGDITAANVTADTEVTAGSVTLTGHTHLYSPGPGSPTPTDAGVG